MVELAEIKTVTSIFKVETGTQLIGHGPLGPHAFGFYVRYLEQLDHLLSEYCYQAAIQPKVSLKTSLTYSSTRLI